MIGSVINTVDKRVVDIGKDIAEKEIGRAHV